MKLKLDENENAVLQDGMPVYQYDDDREFPFDAQKTLDNLNSRIANLEDEKNRFFEKNQELKSQLEPFEGMDPEEATQAIETVRNLNDKQLFDSDGIKALKNEMRASFEEEKAQLKAGFQEELEHVGIERAQDQATIYDLMVTAQFASSEYFTGESPKTIYPPEDAAKIFGDYFRVERNPDGKMAIIAKDKEGKVIMSKTNHGEPAGFSEAIEQIIENHPSKTRFLRSPNGAGPKAGGNTNWRDGDSANKSATDKIAAGLKLNYGHRF